MGKKKPEFRRPLKPIPKAEQRAAYKAINALTDEQLEGNDDDALPRPLAISTGPDDDHKPIWLFLADWTSRGPGGGLRDTIPAEINGTRMLIPKGSTKAQVLAALAELRRTVEIYWAGILIHPQVFSFIIADARWDQHKRGDIAQPDKTNLAAKEEVEDAAEKTALLYFLKFDQGARHDWIDHMLANRPDIRDNVKAYTDNFRAEFDRGNAELARKRSESPQTPPV